MASFSSNNQMKMKVISIFVSTVSVVSTAIPVKFVSVYHTNNQGGALGSAKACERIFINNENGYIKSSFSFVLLITQIFSSLQLISG